MRNYLQIYQTANCALIDHLQNYSTSISEQFDILSEPYFISLLRCIYTHSVKRVAKRFHIPMEHGCILMGIPDPMGVLENGQVYVTYRESSDSCVERKKLDVSWFIRIPVCIQETCSPPQLWTRRNFTFYTMSSCFQSQVEYHFLPAAGEET